MAEIGEVASKQDRTSDEEYRYKKLILEQACYYCQHNIIQSFMPDDITTFGLDPILPAMATLHSITNSHYNDHETGQAVHLLQYVHSMLPEPTAALEKDYIDILISLKSKAVFYEVFSSDHCYASDEQRYAILNKYFPSDIVDDSCSMICSTTGEYEKAMHTSLHRGINNLLSSEESRRYYQQTCFLNCDKSRALWESLAEKVDNYVTEIRKILPVPQLVLSYIKYVQQNVPRSPYHDASSRPGPSSENVHIITSSLRDESKRIPILRPSSIHIQRLPLGGLHRRSHGNSNRKDLDISSDSLEDDLHVKHSTTKRRIVNSSDSNSSERSSSLSGDGRWSKSGRLRSRNMNHIKSGLGKCSSDSDEASDSSGTSSYMLQRRERRKLAFSRRREMPSRKRTIARMDVNSSDSGPTDLDTKSEDENVGLLMNKEHLKSPLVQLSRLTHSKPLFSDEYSSTDHSKSDKARNLRRRPVGIQSFKRRSLTRDTQQDVSSTSTLRTGESQEDTRENRVKQSEVKWTEEKNVELHMERIVMHTDLMCTHTTDVPYTKNSKGEEDTDKEEHAIESRVISLSSPMKSMEDTRRIRRSSSDSDGSSYVASKNDVLSTSEDASERAMQQHKTGEDERIAIEGVGSGDERVDIESVSSEGDERLDNVESLSESFTEVENLTEMDDSLFDVTKSNVEGEQGVMDWEKWEESYKRNVQHTSRECLIPSHCNSDHSETADNLRSTQKLAQDVLTLDQPPSSASLFSSSNPVTTTSSGPQKLAQDISTSDQPPCNPASGLQTTQKLIQDVSTSDKSPSNPITTSSGSQTTQKLTQDVSMVSSSAIFSSSNNPATQKMTEDDLTSSSPRTFASSEPISSTEEQYPESSHKYSNNAIASRGGVLVTPYQPVEAADFPSPKEQRVATSTARLKRFLNSSGASSNDDDDDDDDSSCHSLPQRKQSRLDDKSENVCDGVSYNGAYHTPLLKHQDSNPSVHSKKDAPPQHTMQSLPPEQRLLLHKHERKAEHTPETMTANHLLSNDPMHTSAECFIVSLPKRYCGGDRETSPMSLVDAALTEASISPLKKASSLEVNQGENEPSNLLDSTNSEIKGIDSRGKPQPEEIIAPADENSVHVTDHVTKDFGVAISDSLSIDNILTHLSDLLTNSARKRKNKPSKRKSQLDPPAQTIPNENVASLSSQGKETQYKGDESPQNLSASSPSLLTIARRGQSPTNVISHLTSSSPALVDPISPAEASANRSAALVDPITPTEVNVTSSNGTNPSLIPSEKEILPADPAPTQPEVSMMAASSNAMSTRTKEPPTAEEPSMVATRRNDLSPKPAEVKELSVITANRSPTSAEVNEFSTPPKRAEIDVKCSNDTKCGESEGAVGTPQDVGMCEINKPDSSPTPSETNDIPPPAPSPKNLSPTLSPTARSLSPIARDLSLTARSLSPITRDLSPTARSLSPIARDLSLTARDVSPTARSPSPITRDLSPTARNLSPTARNLSPTARNLSPTARDLSPTARDISPAPTKRRGRLPKKLESLSKPYPSLQTLSKKKGRPPKKLSSSSPSHLIVGTPCRRKGRPPKKIKALLRSPPASSSLAPIKRKGRPPKKDVHVTLSHQQSGLTPKRKGNVSYKRSLESVVSLLKPVNDEMSRSILTTTDHGDIVNVELVKNAASCLVDDSICIATSEAMVDEEILGSELVSNRGRTGTGMSESEEIPTSPTSFENLSSPTGNNLTDHSYTLKSFSSPEVPLASSKTFTGRRNRRLSKIMGLGTSGDEAAGSNELDNEEMEGILQHYAPSMLAKVHKMIQDALAKSEAVDTLLLPQGNNPESLSSSTTTNHVTRGHLGASTSSPDKLPHGVCSDSQDCDIVSDSTMESDNDESPLNNNKLSLLHELYKFQHSLSGRSFS